MSARVRGRSAGLVAEPVETVQVVGLPTLLATWSVDSQGAGFDVSWPDISGATAVEVDAASLTVYPLAGGSSGRSLGTLVGALEGTEAVVTVPDGPVPLRSLHLEGLEVFDGDWLAVRDGGDLPDGWRVAVSVPQGDGFSAPAFAVPPLDLNRGVIPSMLAGGSLEDRVLRLPDVDAARVRLQVLSGDFPDGLQPRQFRVDSISARAAPEPVDLEAVDASGQTVWRQRGRLAAPTTIDLRAPLKRALEAAIAAGDGPRTTITVKSGKPGQVRTAGVAAAGRVLRRFTDKVVAECDGDDAPLPLPAPPLDTRAPARAAGDVVIRHRGLRLHPLSDAVPDRPGDLRGPVLAGNAAVVRVLPPQALRGETLRRIGLVAVVRDLAELSIRVLEVVGDQPAGPLGTAHATTTVEPVDGFAAARPRVVWVELPDPLNVDRSIAVEASVAAGRIHWVALDDGAPRIRFAVTCADPAGETIRFAGHTLELTGPRTQLLRQDLAPAAFRGVPPVVSTDQFCDVVVTNLTLEYTP